jgi:RHH-type transcriptional regulator, rel operon repressor / antitoxin RelB
MQYRHVKQNGKHWRRSYVRAVAREGRCSRIIGGIARTAERIGSRTWRRFAGIATGSFMRWSAPSDGRDPADTCARMYTSEYKVVTETLSIRIDAETKKRLDALSKRSKRSKSFLAAEAIAAYVESEEWQLGEIQAGIAELESGQEVSHAKVSRWLRSWGKRSKTKSPR